MSVKSSEYDYVCPNNQLFELASAQKMTTVAVRALEQDFVRSSKTIGALLYNSFLGGIHIYTTERPTKSFRTLMGARVNIWAIEQDFGRSNV